MVARDLDGGRGGESWARKAGEVVVRCFGFGWRAFESIVLRVHAGTYGSLKLKLS